MGKGGKKGGKSGERSLSGLSGGERSYRFLFLFVCLIDLL